MLVTEDGAETLTQLPVRPRAVARSSGPWPEERIARGPAGGYRRATIGLGHDRRDRGTPRAAVRRVRPRAALARIRTCSACAATSGRCEPTWASFAPTSIASRRAWSRDYGQRIARLEARARRLSTLASGRDPSRPVGGSLVERDCRCRVRRGCAKIRADTTKGAADVSEADRPDDREPLPRGAHLPAAARSSRRRRTRSRRSTTRTSRRSGSARRASASRGSSRTRSSTSGSRRTRSGSSAASSTSPTTASTATSRPAAATRSRSTGRASPPTTGARSPTPTCSREVTRTANALKALGVGEGHGRRHLHGHGPRGADRDARLRAPRRAAHRRLRRLLGRLALRPPARHGLRGADHAGRGVAPRLDRRRSSAPPTRRSPRRRP